MKTLPLNWRFLLLTLLVTSGLFGLGLHRLDLDTDIIGSLPKTEPVLSDATYLLRNHPMQNQVVVDIGLKKADLEALIACGRLAETRLRESGLFKTVGMEDAMALMPGLMEHVVLNLPVLFTAEELDTRVRPLLTPEALEASLEQAHTSLLGLESIGQAAMIAGDPLNLRSIVLARLSHLAPSTGARIARGQILSADGRHLLLIASPASSSTATGFAARITEQMKTLSDELNRAHGQAGQRITLTPVGAYRAALDNERIIKNDVAFAVTVSTVGIAVLLLFAFSRPLIGLFSLLPAVAGTMLAFFAFSLFHKSLSIMVIGFGGAIIALTVDQGIAYLLFLDRPHATSGKKASAEVWGMSLLAVLTTMGAYGALGLSGFPIFVQLGQFTMLGLGLCFLFVHAVFPRIFPGMPPGRRRPRGLQKIVDAFAATGGKGLWAAAVFTGVMLLFAKPVFNVSLQAMNTVGRDTLAAEELLTGVWGGIFDKVYLLVEGHSIAELQDKGDAVFEKISRDLRSEVLASGFVSSMIYPGPELRRNNLDAWRKFWDSGRVETVKTRIDALSAPLGFADHAFDPFFDLLGAVSMPAEHPPIPDPFRGFLGISRSADGSKWIQVSTLTTGPAYDAKRFFEEYRSSARLFDPVFFSETLGGLLFHTSIKLFFIIFVSVAVLLAVFFADAALTLACLLPVLFAFISTLGTLKIMGRALDIPALMLSIVIFGMGIDYAVYFVRSHQRFGRLDHPSFSQVRMAVFLSSATTLIGFGAMGFADHSLLQSTGITAFLGIAYSLIGAFVILPPVLDRIQGGRQAAALKCVTIRERVLSRYRGMEAYPRIFARMKMRLDPLFPELERILRASEGIETMVDVGTGYGVPSSWLLERFPEARLYGIEPQAHRVQVASRAVGERGVVVEGQAPELPETPAEVDMALMLDMVHYLGDEALGTVLNRLRNRLRPGAKLLIRASLPPKRKFPWHWWIEQLTHRFSGVKACYRSAERLREILTQAGFRIENTLPSGVHEELVWLVGEKT